MTNYSYIANLSFLGSMVFSFNYGQTSKQTNKQTNIQQLCFYYIDEPFGLGRFATDHSLTKVAKRLLFVRVTHYAIQLTTASRPFPPQKAIT